MFTINTGRTVAAAFAALSVSCGCIFAADGGKSVPADELSVLGISGMQLPDPFEVEPMRERFLARNGRVFGKIFLSSSEVTPGDMSAALDLSAWLTRVAGSKTPVPVETEPEDPKSLAEMPTGIYIGNTAAAEKLGIFAPVGDGETYLVETRGNAVFIVGKTPMATRIAVGEFLRRILGIEFVWPGDDGAEWTPLNEIPFPRVRIENVPAFAWRLVGTRDDDWNVHLGFGELPRYSHNLGNIFNKAVYAENPEVAPEVFGKKYTDYTGYYAPQPNLKNPAAIDITLAAAEAFFEKNPEAPMFALGINDTTNWDESVESEKAYGPISFYRNLPDRSNYYYDYVNRAADAVRRLNGKSVGAIAYMDVQNTPDFPVRKNVVSVLCADRSMWVFPKFKAEDKALIRRWARSGAEVWGVYDYYYGSPFLFPRLFFKEQAEAIKFVRKQGGKIFYAECGAVVAFDAPKVWLASQLFKNPDADPEKILFEYYAKTFGAAATAMKDFYDYCCAVWKNQGGQCRWIKGWNNENSIEIFPPEKLAHARSLLRKAFESLPKFADEDTRPPRERRILSRLHEISAALTRAEKFSESYFARKALDAAPADSFESAVFALKSPAWRYEEIYNDADFSSLPHRAGIAAYAISDPRPAALLRVRNFLKNTKNPEERAQLNRMAERIFGKAQRSRAVIVESNADVPSLSETDARLRLILESLAAADANPGMTERFEAEDFVAYHPGDWRAGKHLAYPGGWRCIVAASEKTEMSASSDAPHGGNAAFRIAGECERVELARSSRISPGKKVLAQVYARGNVSVGSVSYLGIEFLDAKGKLISLTSASLPVGKTEDWRKLVAAGEAPARTDSVRICLYVGLQGPGDESFFDDLTVTVF